MADAPSPPPLASLARARELKISELSNHFANDDLTLDDLERRIELVYKASSVADLETITADLRSAAVARADPAQAKMTRGAKGEVPTYDVKSRRLLAFMSSTRRVGRWAVPRELDVLAIMADTKLDLTHAILASHVTDFEIRAIMASLKIVVPPGMRVIVDTTSVMSNVRSRADELAIEDAPATANAPVLRLTGYAFMADVEIVVRRREDAVIDEDD